MKTKKLPFTFDVDKLVAEATSIPQSAYLESYSLYVEPKTFWSAHLIEPEFNPDLTVAPKFKPNDLLRSKPYLLEVFETFQCDMETYRVNRLDAGAVLRKHKDHLRSWEEGIFRIHVPVNTTDKVSFMLEGEPVRMKPGECWYINIDLYHELQNDSDTDRLNLIFDCIRNPWWEEVFAREE